MFNSSVEKNGTHQLEVKEKRADRCRIKKKNNYYNSICQVSMKGNLLKINMFDLLISKNLITEFIIVVLGSILALIYHLRLAKAIFFSPHHNETIKIETKLYGLTAIVVIQIMSLIYMNNMATLAGYTESVIVN